jgi:hypothetical protein
MQPSTKRRWRRVLWISAALFICFAFLFADSMGLTYVVVPVVGDAMDWKSHYLAGLRSTNCGRVKIRGDASKATQCALEKNAKGHAFRVIYEIQGIDSMVAGGIVRTSGGKILTLSYDSCPSGCGFSLLQQRVSVGSCPQPYHLYVNPKSRLNCYQPQLSFPTNLMSPNMEPY